MWSPVRRDWQEILGLNRAEYYQNMSNLDGRIVSVVDEDECLECHITIATVPAEVFPLMQNQWEVRLANLGLEHK